MRNREGQRKWKRHGGPNRSSTSLTRCRQQRRNTFKLETYPILLKKLVMDLILSSRLLYHLCMHNVIFGQLLSVRIILTNRPYSNNQSIYHPSVSASASAIPTRNSHSPTPTRLTLSRGRRTSCISLSGAVGPRANRSLITASVIGRANCCRKATWTTLQRGLLRSDLGSW